MSTLFNKNHNGGFPEIVLSPQTLINCAPTTVPFSCAYGSNNIKITDVLDYLKASGVSDESCNNYYGSDKKDCSPLNQCKDCHNGEDMHKIPICEPVSYRSYKLADYTAITSTQPDGPDKIKDLTSQIQNALKQNGPLVCSIKHSEALFSFRSSVITPFVDDNKLPATYTTYVSLVGLGGFGDKANNYFALQASFGENVGYFGIIFLTSDNQTNPLGLLDNCFTIKVAPEPTFIHNSYTAFRNNILTDKGVKTTRRQTSHSLNQGLKLAFVNKEFNVGLNLSHDVTPINWQNKDGRNYLTYVKNQHIPTYCGSCWAQAAISVLADRLNIQRIQSGQVFPKFVLSAQAIINCKEGGTCFGGDSTLLFQKAEVWKIPTESCQTYQAVNPTNYDCAANQVCSNTSAQATTVFDKYNGVRVTAWNRVRGAQAIKAALQNGPIVCGFEVTEEFVKYTKTPGKLNIWDKDQDFLQLNHGISIVGWDIQDGVEYWIVRNSWGREWGYDGFFYMKAGVNMLGIESDCSYADVIFEQYDK